MRILVVEDIQDTRILFKSMLESLGHVALEAENGHRAVDVSIKERPDLVLMDLWMPSMDGFLGTAALRAIGSCKSVPVIAVTAYYSKTTWDQAIAAGCNDCIGKPLTRDQLAALIRRYHPSSGLSDV